MDDSKALDAAMNHLIMNSTNPGVVRDAILKPDLREAFVIYCNHLGMKLPIDEIDIEDALKDMAAKDVDMDSEH